jgi:pimeloyl-ACP methyl ester carboxylesterase
VGFFVLQQMILKKLQLSTHQVQIAYIESEKSNLADRTDLEENTILLFLHEALGSIGQWRNFPKLVCDSLGMNGFVLERRGHGDSDALMGERNNNYLHDYAYDELHEVIQKILPGGKRVILVGHSDGGTIALLYAAKFPKFVSGVVTMAAHVLNEPETCAGIQPAIDAFRAGKLDGLKKFHGEKTESLFFAWANTWLSESFKDWNIVNDIQGIQCPTLAIQGKEDQYGTKLQLDLIQQAIPQAEIAFLDFVKHHPHLEKSAEILSRIEKWYQINFEIID